ncbi:MAG TPA: Ger(x)C family spore germination protein [Symbiobacteriaceae bacterium]|jgi:Ger(x)C family germination protein
MKVRAVLVTLALTFLLTGCWDRVEIEDQIFPIAIAVDKGVVHKYRMAVRIPMVGTIRTGMLGGERSKTTSEIVTVEAESVVQGIFTANATATRRFTLRHLRGIAVGEDLAREGLGDLYMELSRNGEVRDTAAFFVVRGSAVEFLKLARYPGEINPGKLAEGLLLVEKHLHMSPPIRLQHMLNRSGLLGVDPFAPVFGINRGVTGESQPPGTTASAIAGDLYRLDGNPAELAGTGIFRDTRLVGYLTVDETQALLALRGEMGKAYMTFPDPFRPGDKIQIRFHQENKPKVRPSFNGQGPQVTIRLLFEGEVLSGTENFWDPAVRRRLEEAARHHMEQQVQSVLAKTIKWGADPVGFGLRFRSRFATWDDWSRYHWRTQVPKLKVTVTSEMRIRRFGLTLAPLQQKQEK